MLYKCFVFAGYNQKTKHSLVLRWEQQVSELASPGVGFLYSGIAPERQDLTGVVRHLAVVGSRLA